MPDTRNTPYGAFNYLVEINGDEFGGFSDVSGLTTEVTVAEYRTGRDAEHHVRKVPGMHKIGDVTLKRGIVNSGTMWTWIDDVRKKGIMAQRSVVITLLDETHQKVQAWELSGTIPLKYSGPTLAGKGGADVAMEEVVLSAQKLELQGVTF
jgi:phage tail-like protein